MSAKEGHNYAPEGKPRPVVKPGEFVFAAAYYDHGHIHGQINGLAEAGGTLKYVYDSDPARCAATLQKFPNAKLVDSFDRILDDPSIHLVTAAAIPSQRCAIGLRVLNAGKDYFTDKCPFTTLEQLAQARTAVQRTKRKYMVYYSERLHVESAWHACELVRQGAVGRVLQVLLLAPHRLSKASRPAWFFDKAQYGGIITDIGSHQFEQFMALTGAKAGKVNFARVENFENADQPGFEDFGEASLTLDTGASAYCRVDWFTPAGSHAWGDGRLFVLGTQGMLEIRKYMEIAQPEKQDHIYLVDDQGERVIDCRGKIGFPFFGQFILDVLNRTEHAMTQEHAFLAAELSLQAQKIADGARAAR
ncbi:MAG TPA: Gfo/Idh/MocA family oxidoreductase [Opitutales bacterium]|jgi:predicted dehydrogenase|nr:Gfo/Idh/MocA family oxidoreductase [Opitutales bacterium]